MITLKKLDLQFQEDGHVHLLNGSPVPGCTSISALFQDDGWKFCWPPKLMAESLIDRLDRLELEDKDSVNVGWMKEVIKVDKNAWRKKRDKAADTGTQGHEAIETYIKCKLDGIFYDHGYFEIDNPKDDEVINIVQQFFEWEKLAEPQWLASELQVASETHNFAGILDALAIIDGKTILLDFKTSSGIKDEYNIQLAGLMICLEEMGLTVDQRAILHLPKKGKYEYRVIDSDLAFEKECFLAGLKMYHYKNLFLARCK